MSVVTKDVRTCFAHTEHGDVGVRAHGARDEDLMVTSGTDVLAN